MRLLGFGCLSCRLRLVAGLRDFTLLLRGSDVACWFWLWCVTSASPDFTAFNLLVNMYCAAVCVFVACWIFVFVGFVDYLLIVVCCYRRFGFLLWMHLWVVFCGVPFYLCFVRCLCYLCCLIWFLVYLQFAVFVVYCCYLLVSFVF